MSPEGWMAAAEAQVRFLAEHRHPILDTLFIGLTLLGRETFLLFFVAIGYWALNRSVFARAAVMLVLAAFLNSWLKGIFLVPRPDVTPVVDAAGWGFPSGHAQVAAALWGALAWEIGSRNRPAAIGLIALALGVAASRPYLGVHYPHDVVAGLLLGAVQLLLLPGLKRCSPERWVLMGIVGGSLAFAITWFFFDPTVQGLGARLSGAALGLGVGVGLAARTEGGDGALGSEGASILARVSLVAIGVVGLLSVWVGIKMVLVAFGWADVLLPQAIRYAAVGLWIGWGAPLLGARGLHRRGRLPSGATS